MGVGQGKICLILMYTSISIDALMKAGQLVKPKKKNQLSLTLENLTNDQEWEIIEPPPP